MQVSGQKGLVTRDRGAHGSPIIRKPHSQECEAGDAIFLIIAPLLGTTSNRRALRVTVRHKLVEEPVQLVVIDGLLPDPSHFAMTLAGSFLVLVLGLVVFRKTEDKFMYFV